LLPSRQRTSIRENNNLDNHFWRKPLRKSLIACLLLAVSASASAWEYDMDDVTCAEVASDQQVATMMIFWLDGYISAEQGDTSISEDWFNELGSALAEGCEDEPDRKLLDIVKKKVLD